MVLFSLGIILSLFLISFLQNVTPEESSTASGRSQDFYNQNFSVKGNIGLWMETWAAAAVGTPLGE